jgi:hypothetical protein
MNRGGLNWLLQAIKDAVLREAGLPVLMSR